MGQLWAGNGWPTVCRFYNHKETHLRFALSLSSLWNKFVSKGYRLLSKRSGFCLRVNSEEREAIKEYRKRNHRKWASFKCLAPVSRDKDGLAMAASVNVEDVRLEETLKIRIGKWERIYYSPCIVSLITVLCLRRGEKPTTAERTAFVRKELLLRCHPRSRSGVQNFNGRENFVVSYYTRLIVRSIKT